VITTNGAVQDAIANTNTVVENTTITNIEQTSAATTSDTQNIIAANTTTNNTATTTVNNSTTGSVISAPSLSDNKKIVSYLLEVEIVN
jgi:hypothetical protein